MLTRPFSRRPHHVITPYPNYKRATEAGNVCAEASGKLVADGRHSGSGSRIRFSAEPAGFAVDGYLYGLWSRPRANAGVLLGDFVSVGALPTLPDYYRGDIYAVDRCPGIYLIVVEYLLRVVLTTVRWVHDDLFSGCVGVQPQTSVLGQTILRVGAMERIDSHYRHCWF